MADVSLPLVRRLAREGWNRIGVLLAAFALVHYAMLLDGATNDNFMHMALARQLLAGDLPVRDFFDSGVGLMYVLSAMSELVFGYRWLSEAVIVGLAWSVSTWLVFRLVRQLTGSTAAAALSAVLLIVAGPRGYSYPKGIVYAVAAVLWWAYAAKPAAARAAALGAWVAIAFYWRPDHGLYVAIGTVLAIVSSHGVTRDTLRRSVLAGLVTLVLVAPFLVYVQAVDGLSNYLNAEIAQSVYENARSGGHKWPLTHLPSGFLQLDGLTRGSEMTVAAFEALPLLAVLLAVTPLRRRVAALSSPAHVVGFALFALVVDAGLLRTPFEVRAVDGVVLPAILLGICVTALARTADTAGALRRSLAAVLAVTMAVVVVGSVAAAGRLTHQGAWVLRLRSGDGWRRPFTEFVASPPIDYFHDRPADPSIRFAEYVRRCVPQSDRILVLWFAPEIYYYSDRLMASRHVVFVTNWADLPHEQDATLAKIERYAPPIALARRAALVAYTREAFPGVVDYVEQHYDIAATVDDYPGEQYLVLARKGRRPTGRYGPRPWPCYT